MLLWYQEIDFTLNHNYEISIVIWCFKMTPQIALRMVIIFDLKIYLLLLCMCKPRVATISLLSDLVARVAAVTIYLLCKFIFGRVSVEGRFCILGLKLVILILHYH